MRSKDSTASESSQFSLNKGHSFIKSNKSFERCAQRFFKCIPSNENYSPRKFYTFQSEKAAYLFENDSKARKEIIQSEQQSNVLSEAYKSPLKTGERSEEYNLPSDQEKAQNRVNFITLGTISEQEKIEIIQRGFQLQAEGKISLKKYYESTDSNSLFQLKGYQIKYETIRRKKLYQQLKPSNN